MVPSGKVSFHSSSSTVKTSSATDAKSSVGVPKPIRALSVRTNVTRDDVFFASVPHIFSRYFSSRKK
jgi:hypothetical protein